MPKISPKKRWEGRKSKGKIDSILFSDIFHRYLSISKNKSCLEIGCVPGQFLAYICKRFKYNAEGLDYVKNTSLIVGKTLEANGIKNYKIYESDFLKWKSKKKRDLVCSFGFVEHFSGETNEKVIEKHIYLLKSGGKLILDVPNFNYLQHFFHSILDIENLKEHNIKTMNLLYFKNIAKKFNLRIIYLGYYGGLFEYWGLTKNPNILQIIFYIMLKLLDRTIGKIKWNNKFLSPYIIFVAEKI